MSDLNKVMLIGRLTADPEMRTTLTGSQVASFSIANNRTYNSIGERKEQVSFFNCIAWNKLGELIVQYCKKGQRIGIEGRLQHRSWEDQQGNKRSTVEIVVENFQFLSPREESASDTVQNSVQGEVVDNEPDMFGDKDIPF